MLPMPRGSSHTAVSFARGDTADTERNRGTPAKHDRTNDVEEAPRRVDSMV